MRKPDIFANNNGADQPAHPRSLTSAFTICSLESIIAHLDLCKITIFQLLYVAEQADLSITCS